MGSPLLERRRRTSQVIGISGCLLSAGWALGQLANHWPESWVNLVGCVVFASTTVAGRRGHLRAGTVVGIGWSLMHLTLLGGLGLGVSTGAFRWFFVIALVPFYMLDERDRWLSYLFGAWAGVGAVSMELGLLTGPADLVATVDPDLLRLSRAVNTALVVLVLVAIIGATVRDQTRAEQEAESLLHRILPAAVVGRLRQGEARIADAVDDATVLFADLVGFTGLAASRAPSELVEILEAIFLRFDGICAAHGLEKIKTIGDAYMAVAGVTDQKPDGTSRAAAAAIAMRDAVAELAESLGVPLQIRVGLHRGPLVAGVLGEARLAFDVWGDTVNVASRMESHGLPGEIHVTTAIREALSPAFAVRPRGVVNVKGIGEMETYLLQRRD